MLDCIGQALEMAGVDMKDWEVGDSEAIVMQQRRYFNKPRGKRRTRKDHNRF